MKATRFFVACLLLFLFFTQTTFAQDKIIGKERILSLLDKGGKIPVIVTFKVEKWQEMADKSAALKPSDGQKQSAGNPDAQLRSAIQGTADSLLGGLPAGSFSHKRTFSVIPGMAISVNKAALQSLAANPRISRIVEDRPEKLPPQPDQPKEDGISKPLLNDSTSLIGADAAWSMGYTGAGQYVAILDTGVLTSHEMFSGKTFIEACFGSYADGTVEGKEYTSSPFCPTGNETEIGPGTAAPAIDHGTHVAGIAAGNNRSYTAGEARRGVAYNADIVAVQVFSEFTSTYYCGGLEPCYLSWDSDQIAGLEYVYSLRGSHNIAAINMSLGGGSYTEYCNDPRKPIIDLLRNTGIATVIATGNDSYCSSVGAPACISSAIAVGASDKNDVEALYNNYHPTLQEFFAPGGGTDSGTGILSAVTSGNSAYGQKSGTSMATPHVTGTIAILREAFPKDSISDFEEKLRNSGTSLTGSCTGATAVPRINVDQALKTSIFPWPTFLAAITGNKSSEWGAHNTVCCSSGWASFNLRTEGTTKHAVLPSCSSTSPTWEGWQRSGDGAKAFSWSLTSDGCGTIGGSFSYPLDKDKSYLFYPYWTGSAIQMKVAIFSEKEAKSEQFRDVSDLQTETVNEVKALPFGKGSGLMGSWQQCSQP